MKACGVPFLMPVKAGIQRFNVLKIWIPLRLSSGWWACLQWACLQWVCRICRTTDQVRNDRRWFKKPPDSSI